MSTGTLLNVRGDRAAPSQPERGRPRPPLLRALGSSEPPRLIEIGGVLYRHVKTFKHDSWAASALYRSSTGMQIVCKFNRIEPVCGLPLAWLGRALARREARLLELLADEPLVPGASGAVHVGGRPAAHAVAHAFVPGRPLARRMPLHDDFYPRLEELLARLHARGVAYVDLHKRENILVGTDGRPYLIDFQISVCLPPYGLRGPLLRMLQRCDRYHLSKHIRRYRLERGEPAPPRDFGRPWSIWLHRALAVPFRTFRRRLLMRLGVRTAGGRADSEAAPEPGVLGWTTD